MAYVKAEDGAQFGQVPGFTEFMKQSCVLDPSQAGCKEYFDKLYAGVRAESKKAVARLQADPIYGPVLAQVLDGASNPAEIGARAKQLAAGFSSDALKQSAYRFFYSQARTGLEMADQYLSAYPQARVIGSSLEQVEKQYFEGRNIFQRYEKTGLDAAGVADVMNLMKKSVTTARSLAAAFNVPEEADEALQWAGIALGCGAAIAIGASASGIGAVGGAITCAVSVLAKVFSKLVGKPAPVVDPDMTVFAQFRPSDSQRGLIASDAVRLASLLKYRYGVPSWQAMWNKSAGATSWRGGGWPMLREYTAKMEGLAVGFTQQQAFDLIGGYFGGGGLAQLWWIATQAKAFPGNWYTDPPPASAYGDLPVREFYKAAKVAATTSFPVWPPSCYANCRSAGPDTYRGGLVWAELLTFFAAVTARELGIDPSYVVPWKDGLPVRFWYATKEGGNLNTDPRYIKNDYRYPFLEWTNFAGPRNDLRKLLTDVSHLNPDALIQFASIRLLAALSYMRMLREWGEYQDGGGLKSLRGGRDLIAELDNLTPRDPGYVFRMPVDPRREAWGGKIPTVQQLVNKIYSTAGFMNSIADKARKDAKDDFKVVQLAGKAKRKMLMLQKGAPGAAAAAGMTAAAMKAMIQARGGLELVSEAGKKCIAAGGAYFPGGAKCDINPTTKKLENCRKPPAGYTGKLWPCVPRGTPGGVLTPGAVMPGVTPPTRAAGAGTILAVAGAGLLLMQLLRS